MKVTTLGQLENGIERVANELNQYATKTELAGKLDSTGKAETAGTADNAIRDGEGNIITSTYLKKSDNVSVDLSDYVTKSEASNTYLAKTALNIISAVPVQNGTITYDGTAKTPTWLNYDTSKLQISGDYQNKTNVGTYPVGFKPISPYTWSNGTQELKNGTWAIGKAAGSLSLSAESGSVNIDATSTFTVNRAGDGAITVTSSNSNVASVSVSGNTVTITGKAAGSATITVKVAEGTNHFAPANKTFAVTVTKIPLNLSASISSAVTYNTTGTINISGNSGGGAVTATSANSSCVTVPSTTASTVTVKCTNYSAATTQITINVAETTKYTSGTTTCNVTTTKATPTLTLSAESVVLTPANPSTTVTVTTNSTGAISAKPSDSFSCSTAVNEKTISIAALSHATAFVTVTVSESDNFYAVSKNISVDIRNAPVNMLEGRTLAQLQTLIKNGEALNYFQVGDYFDITFTTDVFILQNGAYDSKNNYIESYDFKIPANSTWRAVCIGINHNPSIEGINRFHFAVIKNTQNQNRAFIGQMNDSKTNEGGWEACKMRTWLNGTFYNALPTALQAVISPCTKYTDNVGGSQLETNITATSDKIWIPSVFEYNGTGVLNRNTFNTYESNVQQQYEWFANGNGNTFDLFFKDFGISKIKYLNGTFSGNGNFWSRSPSHRNTTNFAEYSASYHGANAIDPIVPCFTIA